MPKGAASGSHQAIAKATTDAISTLRLRSRTIRGASAGASAATTDGRVAKLLTLRFSAAVSISQPQ